MQCLANPNYLNCKLCWYESGMFAFVDEMSEQDVQHNCIPWMTDSEFVFSFGSTGVFQGSHLRQLLEIPLVLERTGVRQVSEVRNKYLVSVQTAFSTPL